MRHITNDSIIFKIYSKNKNLHHLIIITQIGKKFILIKYFYVNKYKLCDIL